MTGPGEMAVLRQHLGDGVRRAAEVLRQHLSPLAPDDAVLALARRVLAAGWPAMARELEELRGVAQQGGHLVDAAAPAMRSLLGRVAAGQLDVDEAVGVLLDWPNRAGPSV